MEKLPCEVLLQIFEHLPYSTFKTLYCLFPQHLLDEALVYKLRKDKATPTIDLISTNLHELSTNFVNKRNESFMPLYFTAFDSTTRFIWTLPNFSCSQHYFKVKDAYVSHGKLVVRRPRDSQQQQKTLLSLWDIRKSFPPMRAGSFSGASEYTRMTSHELTIYQPGCILDLYLMPSMETKDNNNMTGNKSSRIIMTKKTQDDKGKEQRPALPSEYIRQYSTNNKHNTSSPWVPTSYPPNDSCGYFLVERLAISIPDFLKLF